MALLMIMSFTGDLITTTMRWSLKKGLSPSHHLCPTSLEALSDFAVSPRIRRELDSSESDFAPFLSNAQQFQCHCLSRGCSYKTPPGSPRPFEEIQSVFVSHPKLLSIEV